MRKKNLKKFSHQEKLFILKKKLLSVPEMHVRYDFLTEGLLRSLLFNRYKNGLSRFVSKWGASYSIDARKFEKWLETRYKVDEKKRRAERQKLYDKTNIFGRFNKEGEEMLTPDEEEKPL